MANPQNVIDTVLLSEASDLSDSRPGDTQGHAGGHSLAQSSAAREDSTVESIQVLYFLN